MIKEKCHCCGSEIDITLPEHKGLLINRKASLASQIIMLDEMIKRSKDTIVKSNLEEQLKVLRVELKQLEPI